MVGKFKSINKMSEDEINDELADLDEDIEEDRPRIEDLENELLRREEGGSKSHKKSIRAIKSRKYEKEIRPRIKLYKFENLSEDVQNKLIDHEIEFYGEVMVDELSDYAKEEMPILFAKKGFKNVDLQIDEWDISRNYIEISMEFNFDGFELSYRKGLLEAHDYDNYEYLDIPNKLHDKIMERIREVKAAMLSEMRDDYESRTDPEFIKEDLIEQGNLYTADGELKENG